MNEDVAMQVKINTYGQPVMNEIHHAEVIRVPVPVAQVVIDRMGAPYESGPQVSRWAGAFLVPTVCGAVPVAFKIVVCQRGASIRCQWEHRNTVQWIVAAMMPDFIVEIVETPIRVG